MIAVGVAVGLAGFVSTNAFHAHDHYVDHAHGGRDGDWIQLLALAALGGVALLLHIRSRSRVTAPDATSSQALEDSQRELAKVGRL